MKSSDSARKVERRWELDASKNQVIPTDYRRRAALPVAGSLLEHEHLERKIERNQSCLTSQSGGQGEQEEEKAEEGMCLEGSLGGERCGGPPQYEVCAEEERLASFKQSTSLRAQIICGMYRSLRDEIGQGNFGPHLLLPSFYGCRRASVVDVFLGGACNPTTWRVSLAVPFLQTHGISFFNPQVDEWCPELVAIEARVKTQARILFFVIGQTRSIASMVEVAELVASHRRMILVVEPFCSESALLAGAGFQANADIKSHLEGERRDLLRGRAYLREVAMRHGVELFDNVPAGLLSLLHVMQSLS